MFVNFSEETQHILKQAEKERDELNHPYVGSEHLFLSILKEARLSDVLKKHKVTYKKFKDKLISLVGTGSKKSSFILYTPLLKRVLENAVIEAREENNQIVNPEILIISILDEEDGVAYGILRGLNVNVDRLYYDIKNKKTIKGSKRKKLLLDEMGTNLTKLAKEKRLDPVIGRDDEIAKTIEILLRRKKNNPILIGPAGVGKTAIVEGIANLMISDRCPRFLQNKKIISLNIFSLVSGTKYRGEFEEKMKTLIKELEENDDIILFIDEIHTMVGAGGAEGAIDASNIFKPALARGAIRIIGATTLDEYKKFIEPDAALARRFQQIVVEEPSRESVVKILTEIKPLYENYHNIKIPNNLIDSIVNYSEKYLKNRFEPDRSIDVLDEVCARSSVNESYEEKKKSVIEERLAKVRKEKYKALSGNDFKRAYDLKNEENKLVKDLDGIRIGRKVVSKADVLEVIKRKSNVPIIQVNEDRKKFYEELKRHLNSTVIGQEQNVNKLVDSLRRKDVSENKKCYSVFISGKPGSGKTLLAETYLKLLVNEKHVIKLDLSEYKEHYTISKLIGTTAGYLGYDNKNNVFEKIRTSPNSAIIVDNFEESCDEVKNLFIRILEDGYVEDGVGKLIDFSNTIIIFTTSVNKNDSVGFNNKHKEDLSFVSKRLLDRVGVKVSMNEVSKEDLKKIIDNKLNKIISKYDKITINVSDDFNNYLIDKIEKEKNLGNVDRVIEDEFESKVVEALINYKKSVSISKSNQTSDILS